MNINENICKIIDTIEKFSNEIFLPEQKLVPKREIAFSKKELEEVIFKFAIYFKINKAKTNFTNDKIEFEFIHEYATIYGIYELIVNVKIIFKKKDNLFKLTRLEMSKRINKIY